MHETMNEMPMLKFMPGAEAKVSKHAYGSMKKAKKTKKRKHSSGSHNPGSHNPY